MYLRGWVRPESAVTLFHTLEASLAGKFLPDVLKLVFKKQRDSLYYSRAVFVPSGAMQHVIHRCYPDVPEARVKILPWGSWEEFGEDAAIDREAVALRRRYQIPSGRPFF